METLQEVRDFFEGDKYATKVTGAVIEEFAKDYAKCSLKLTDDHRNAIGAVMGGVIYTMCDFAFAVAANNDQVGTVTAVSNLSFLTGVKGEYLYAEAKAIKNGRSLCTFEVNVTDELGTNVAHAIMTGAKVGGR